MTQWWENFSVRERVMVAGAGLFAAIFVLYQFVAVPLGAWHQGAKAREDSAALGLEQVILAARLHGGQTVSAGTQPDIDATTPLKSAITSSAAATGLVVSSIDGDDNRVQITLAAADPETLYKWMAALEAQYGAMVVEAQVSRARNNNQMVKADRLVFVRQASQ